MSLRPVPLTMRDPFFMDPFFATNWMDFDDYRNEMMRESRAMWNLFNDQMERMDVDLPRAVEGGKKDEKDEKDERDEKEPKKAEKSDKETNGSAKTVAPRMPPMRQFLRLFGDESAGHEGRLTRFNDQVIKVQDNDKSFDVSLDTHHYKPEEIKVTVDNDTKVLKIEGKHEDKSEDGSHLVSRQFSRQYTLPTGCKPEDVHSSLSADGVLMINAPKAGQAITNVPIEKK